MFATNCDLCWLGDLQLAALLGDLVDRRVFSIAITAWSAKVLLDALVESAARLCNVTSSIWRSVNGRTSARRMKIAPMASPAWTKLFADRGPIG
jgi:hypothetical protein